jgi:hypothetical protein
MTTINLPIPNAEEVATFKELYKKHRGIDLPGDEVLDLALRWLQLFFFMSTPPPGMTDVRRAQVREELIRARTEAGLPLTLEDEPDL